MLPLVVVRNGRVRVKGKGFLERLGSAVERGGNWLLPVMVVLMVSRLGAACQACWLRLEPSALHDGTFAYWDYWNFLVEVHGEGEELALGA